MVHLGDVYLNGKSLYEATSLEGVRQPVLRTTGVGPDWEGVTEYLSDPQGSLKTYFATVEDDCTVIYANFGGADPNVEQVEINVRPNCVKPVHVGINYITLEGLEICCAATQWNPPTGVQSGMVDTYWSKGWIIEKLPSA